MQTLSRNNNGRGFIFIKAACFFFLVLWGNLSLASEQELWRNDKGEIVTPVFIMGLHRSGTTFLYETLTKIFPLAYVSVFDVVNSDQLPTCQPDQLPTEMKKMEKLLADLGISDRMVDNIVVTPQTVEEYGWVLNKQSGRFDLNPANFSHFVAFVKNVSRLKNDNAIVLLKNPWDAENAEEIKKLIPHAKFIFIERNELDVMNSMLKSTLHYGSQFDPFLAMLLGEKRGFFNLQNQQRWGYYFLGKDWYADVAAKIIVPEVQQKTRSFKLVVEKMMTLPFSSTNTAIAIRYEDILERKDETLAKLEDFLLKNFPLLIPQATFSSIELGARPRSLHPAIAKYVSASESELKN